MSAPGAVSCEALGETTAPALAALFQRVGSSCYCSYWHFGGDKNAWQARLAFEPGENERELFERARSPLAGVIARTLDDSVIGWMKLEPAANVAKIYDQRPYRALPALGAERTGVWTVGCFLVDERFRRHGVASALLRAGIELARAHGALCIEAFPRRAEGVRDEELWTGPLPLFEQQGFRIVHEQAQYPVLRLDFQV